MSRQMGISNDPRSCFTKHGSCWLPGVTDYYDALRRGFLFETTCHKDVCMKVDAACLSVTVEVATYGNMQRASHITSARAPYVPAPVLELTVPNNMGLVGKLA
eukprot:5327447-Amphidinium_carterae.1